MNDEFREIARSGLASFVEEVSTGPEWEELISAPVVPGPTRPSGWLIGAATAVVILGLIGISLIAQPDQPLEPVTPASTLPLAEPVFDPVEAAGEAALWWSHVTAGDSDAAIGMSHPDAVFNLFELQDILGLVGVGVAVEISPQAFGTDSQPQLCWKATGAANPRTGSMVFRLDGGEWRIWEVRPEVDRCQGVGQQPVAPEIETFEVKQPVPIRIFATEGSGRSFSLIELDSGTITAHSPGSHTINDLAGAMMDDEGRLVVWSYEPSVWVFEDNMLKPYQVLQPFHLAGLGSEVRAISTGDTEGTLDGLWVVNTVPETTVATLFDLSTRAETNHLRVPGNAFPVAAWGSGLILNTEEYEDTGDGFVTRPGSERIVTAAASGLILDRGAGRAIAMGDNRLARLACPESLPACEPYRDNELVVSSLSSKAPATRFVVEKPFDGTWLTVDGPMVPSGAMPMTTVSPDGQRLLVQLGRNLDVNGQPTSSELVAVDLMTGEVTTMDILDSETPVATWSRDGRWVVTFHDRDVTVIEVADPSNTFTYESLIPDDQYPLAAG